MDPDANLEETRRLVARLLAFQDMAHDPKRGDLREEGAQAEADAYRLAELVDALDKWMTAGNFMPKDWLNGRLRKP